MKIYKILIILMIFMCKEADAQNDTTKTKPLTYIEIYQYFTFDPGHVIDNSNFSIEIGKQIDVFSIGFDIGKNSFSNFNSTNSTYIEIRPNLNVFQQGRFTNTLTTGIGYAFRSDIPDVNSKTNYMFGETTIGIEYTQSDKIHINTYFGEFDYNGGGSKFFGVSLTYYFLPYKDKSLIKR